MRNDTAAAAGNATAAAPGGNGTAAGAATGNGTAGSADAGTGTFVFQGQKNSTNALGYIGATNLSISQQPYIIKRCDQVLLIPGQRILSFDDYCQKQDAFFTMSIYMVNVFDGQDPSKLLQSITMDKITHMPTHLAGSPGCIDFQGESKRMAMCFKNAEMVDELIEAHQAFMRCRKGDNLKGFDIQNILHVLEKCMGQGNLDQKTLNDLGLGHLASNSTEGAHSATGHESNKTKYNPYYAELKVPGS